MNTFLIILLTIYVTIGVTIGVIFYVIHSFLCVLGGKNEDKRQQELNPVTHVQK